MNGNALGDQFKQMGSEIVSAINRTIQSNINIPRYEYKTSFTEWAEHVGRIVEQKLDLHDAELIKFIAANLNGHAGRIATYVASLPEYKMNYDKFVQMVEYYLTEVGTSDQQLALSLRQCEVKGSDFSNYAFTKYYALQRTDKGLKTEERHLLLHLIAGLEPEYFDALGTQVLENKIKTFQEFVTKGIEIQRKLSGRRGHTLVANPANQQEIGHLMSDYYANAQQKKVSFAQPNNRPATQNSYFNQQTRNNQYRNNYKTPYPNYNNQEGPSNEAPYNNNQRINSNNSSNQQTNPSYSNNQNNYSTMQNRSNNPASQADPARQNALNNNYQNTYPPRSHNYRPPTARENERLDQELEYARAKDGWINSRQEQRPLPNDFRNRFETNPQLVITPQVDDELPEWKRILYENGFRPPTTNEMPRKDQNNYVIMAKPCKKTKMSWETAIAGFDKTKYDNFTTDEESDEEKTDLKKRKYNWPTKNYKNKPASFTSDFTDSEISAYETAVSITDSTDEAEVLVTDTEMSSDQSEYETTENSSYTDSDSMSETNGTESEYTETNGSTSETAEFTTSEQSLNETTELETETEPENLHIDQCETSETNDQHSSSDDSIISQYKVIITDNLEKLKPVKVKVNGRPAMALFDTCSTSTFASQALTDKLQLPTQLVRRRTHFTGLNSASVGSPRQETQVMITCYTKKGQYLQITTPAYVEPHLASKEVDLLIGRNVLAPMGLMLCPTSGRPLSINYEQQRLYMTQGEFEEQPSQLEVRNDEAYETVPIADGTIRIGNQLNMVERDQIIEFVNTTIDAFAIKETDLGRSSIIEHIIDTGDHPPIAQKPYPIKNMALSDEINRQINLMLQMRTIRVSRSPYASPVVVVPKKDGTARMCVDYRALNKITKKDAFPMFAMDRILGSIKNAHYFTAFDIKSGYHQIAVREQDKEKTAFVLPNGLYEYNVMPFGLCNAPATFQRMMNTILEKMLFKGVVVYLDDILIYSSNFNQHLADVARVVSLLRSAGLKLNMKKCLIGLKSLTFLGYNISGDGLKPDPENIRAIKNLPIPKTTKQIKQAHGLFSFYRKFIPGFATIAAPLTDLTKEDSKFIWGTEQQDAFETLRTALIKPPILVLFDPEKETELRTDGSGVGLGAVLVQKHGDHWKPVAYASRKLVGAERNYSPTDLESAAVMYGISKYEQYLLPIEFTIVTDHQSLTFLDQPKVTPKLTRWAIRLQEYRFKIRYKSGKKNIDADRLSRLPVDSIRIESTLERPLNDVEQECDDKEFCFMTTPISSNELKNEIIQLQDQDYAITQKKKQLENLGNANPTRRRKLQNFVLISGALYRISVDSTPDKLVVPVSKRKDIIAHFHESSGHSGILRTYLRISLSFWWALMRKDVMMYINKCEECHTRTRKYAKRPPLVPTTVERPFQKLAVDVIERRDPEQGPQYIVVAIDYFTKWVEAKLVPKNDAKEMAIFLCENVIYRHGSPETLLTDRGTPFISELYRMTCAVAGIQKLKTTAYHPESNGEVERVNRTLKSLLRAGAWTDSKLALALLAYNTTPNVSTRYSPFFLLYGRRPHLPMDMVLEIHDPNRFETYNDYCHHIEEQWRNAREEAFISNKIIRDRNKRYYDRNAKPNMFKVGDLVMREDPYSRTVTRGRYMPKYKGPYRIVKFISSTVVVLELANDQARTRITTEVIHLSKIIPAAQSSTPVNPQVLVAKIEFSEIRHKTTTDDKGKKARKKTTKKKTTKQKPALKKATQRAKAVAKRVPKRTITKKRKPAGVRIEKTHVVRRQTKRKPKARVKPKIVKKIGARKPKLTKKTKKQTQKLKPLDNERVEEIYRKLKSRIRSLEEMVDELHNELKLRPKAPVSTHVTPEEALEDQLIRSESLPFRISQERITRETIRSQPQNTVYTSANNVSMPQIATNNRPMPSRTGSTALQLSAPPHNRSLVRDPPTAAYTPIDVHTTRTTAGATINRAPTLTEQIQVQLIEQERRDSLNRSSAPANVTNNTRANNNRLSLPTIPEIVAPIPSNHHNATFTNTITTSSTNNRIAVSRSGSTMNLQRPEYSDNQTYAQIFPVEQTRANTQLTENRPIESIGNMQQSNLNYNEQTTSYNPNELSATNINPTSQPIYENNPATITQQEVASYNQQISNQISQPTRSYLVVMHGTRATLSKGYQEKAGGEIYEVLEKRKGSIKGICIQTNEQKIISTSYTAFVKYVLCVAIATNTDTGLSPGYLYDVKVEIHHRKKTYHCREIATRGKVKLDSPIGLCPIGAYLT